MREPHFWHVTDLQSRASAPLTRAVLWPISKLYAHFGARRIAKTNPHKASIPVICIGNLTVGGSGKTPVVMRVREYLTQKGLRASSLSRGYKGELKGPLKVDFAKHTAREVGDEPLMLACSGEAWIGADRVAASKAMVADGVQIIIMDDGHQNPTLHKDLSIIVVDGGNPIGNGKVFPSGPLREPVETGLARADSLLIIGGGEKQFTSPRADLPLHRAQITPRAPAPPGPLIAFAGIGRPTKFFDTLTQAGADLVETVPFPDHHAFSQSDLNLLTTLSKERGAKLITTEKDYVRLAPDQRDGILAFPITLTLSDEMLDQMLAPVMDKLA